MLIEGVVILAAMIGGGALIIYSPSLTKPSPPPQELGLGGSSEQAAGDPKVADDEDSWPAWPPVAVCILVLGVGLFLVWAL
jgi:hypothetical protein